MDGRVAFDCTLTFERSSSPYYREAVRLARTVPGYRRSGDEGRERHSVPLSVAALPLAERLLRLVTGWRGSLVEVQGIALYGAETFRLLQMLRCYRRRERSRLGTLYCWGLPERARGRLPCRLVNIRTYASERRRNRSARRSGPRSRRWRTWILARCPRVRSGRSSWTRPGSTTTRTCPASGPPSTTRP
jgi:hypothetical protein